MIHIGITIVITVLAIEALLPLFPSSRSTTVTFSFRLTVTMMAVVQMDSSHTMAMESFKKLVGLSMMVML